MRRSSARRAQVDPIPALVAVAVLAVAVGSAGLVFRSAAVDGGDRNLAPPALDRALETVRSGGVARPRRLARVDAPAGYRLNVTLRAGPREWSTGPTPPETADAAAAPLAVRVDPTTVRAGRLRVVVWR